MTDIETLIFIYTVKFFPLNLIFLTQQQFGLSAMVTIDGLVTRLGTFCLFHEDKIIR